MRKNIIITGLPRSGKSTLLEQVIKNYKNKVGFLTGEITKDKQRVGFKMETHSGKKEILAHINFKTPFKVSKYFINVDNLEKIILDVKNFKKGDLLFLDEVGQMELFSDKFRKLALQYLNSENICLMTLSAVHEDKLITEIKNRKDIIIVELEENQRKKKKEFVRDLIKKIIKAKKYCQEKDRFKLAGNKAIMKSKHDIRHLRKENNKWKCNCSFFTDNKICSHVIVPEKIESEIIK